jgi:trans-aconitate 2-methyltransferase
VATDTWDPGQYERFAAERSAPFLDLLSLVDPVPGGRVVDLGCGTGALTAEAHRRLGAAETVGIDSSDAMLTEAASVDVGGVRFEAGDIGAFDDPGAWDVVLANAALQWVPDHPAVLARWARALRPGGQLAVQVPANVDHASHRTIQAVAEEAPFASAFGPDGPPPDPVLRVLRPEQYAELLHDLGFEDQTVRLQVYGHVLPSTEAVVEWVKGTSLTRIRSRLPEELYARFLARYTERLVAELGDRRPYFYAFKRILFRARRPQPRR